MSLPAELDFDRDREASPARMNRAMEFLYLSLKAAAARQPEFESALAELRESGAARIAEALGPAYLQAQEIGAGLAALEAAGDGDLVFANFVDFDTLYGHPRDVSGYARALEAFDARLPELVARLRPGDLALLTADHGNDPTFRGSDHTREAVPVLGWGAGARALGRIGFADVGETLAAHLGLAPGRHGRALL